MSVYTLTGVESYSYSAIINGQKIGNSMTSQSTGQKTARTHVFELTTTGQRELLEVVLMPDFKTKNVLVSGIKIELSNVLGYADNQNTQIYYISPSGTGTNSGLTSEDSAPLSSLNSLISAISATTERGIINLRADLGSYSTSAFLINQSGFSADKKITIRGFNPDYTAYSKAKFVGTRQSPWVASSSNTGADIIRLGSDAKNLIFEDIEFENIGNGGFRIINDTENLEFKNIKSSNSSRLFENYISGGATSATLNNIKVKFIESEGFTRGMLRFRYNSTNITLEDIYANSEQQETSGGFAMAIVFDGDGEDVEITRVSTLNSYQDDGAAYWNGDGIAIEEDVLGTNINYAYSANHTDSGFDIKGANTTLYRAISQGNKRNFRIWNNITCRMCESYTPVHRGGTGDAHHIGAYATDKVFSVYELYLKGTNTSSSVFATQSDPILNIYSGEIEILTGTTEEFHIDGGVVNYSQGVSIQYE